MERINNINGIMSFVEDHMNYENAILFSGGYDSTLLLASVMANINKNPTKYGKLYILYVNNDFTGMKNQREDTARNQILTHLRKKFPDVNLDIRCVRVSLFKDEGLHPQNYSLIQPLIWLPSLVMALPVVNDMSILLSFINPDQTTAFRDDIREFIRISYEIGKTKGQIPSVEFPFLLMKKMETIQALLKLDKVLFEYATSCENTTSFDFCGRCIPCQDLQSALIDIIRAYGRYKQGFEYELVEYCKGFLREKFHLEVEIKYDHSKME